VIHKVYFFLIAPKRVFLYKCIHTGSVGLYSSLMRPAVVG
jgi:hypothetical protein